MIHLFLIPPSLVYVAFGLLGAIVGSLINVAIRRLPECGAAITFHENVPVFRHFSAGEQCEEGEHHISTRYPLVEGVTAFLWIAVVWHDRLTVVLPFDLVFVTAITALVFIDSGHMILPNVITYPGIAFALIARVAIPYLTGQPHFDDVPGLEHFSIASGSDPAASLVGALIGAAVGGGSLWLMGEAWKKLRKKEAMGLGDVKMMLMVGAYLGWRLTILNIFLGALSGSIIGVCLMVYQGKRDLQQLLPFGVYLGIGAIIAVFFGSQIVNWYMGFY